MLFMKHMLLLALLLLGATSLHAKEENISVEANGLKLCGTLATPDGGSDTAVLIIAGSGPTDRNGNSGLGLGANCYMLLARFLEEAGVASLRYDKRGIGASTLDRERMDAVVLEDFIDDARALARYLKRERGYGRVVLAGHSEGALIAMAVAAGNSDVDAVVSLCGAGYPLDVILKKQIGRQTEQLGLSLTLRIYGIIDTLKAGRTPQIPSQLESLFPPSVLPFIISSLQYDPVELASRVEQPMLIVGGEHDIQVGPENAAALARAQPAAEVAVIEKMSHVLKSCDDTSNDLQLVSVYRNGDLPLSSGLERTLREFFAQLRE